PGLDLVEDAELLEDRRREGKERLADPEPGERLFLEDEDLPAAPGEQVPRGGSRRPSSHDEDVVIGSPLFRHGFHSNDSGAGLPGGVFRALVVFRSASERLPGGEARCESRVGGAMPSSSEPSATHRPVAKSSAAARGPTEAASRQDPRRLSQSLGAPAWPPAFAK